MTTSFLENCVPRLTAAMMIVISLAGCNRQAPPAAAQAKSTFLRQVQVIELPGVEGRFDHFAADVKGGRLFVAALGNGTMEVIDTAAGKRAGSVTGLKKPQGVAFMPESGRVAVACGDDGSVRFYDAATLKPTGPVATGLDDADNLRYDSAGERLFVGYGSGALVAIEPKRARKVGEIKLERHPESFQLERQGARIFVNVPEAGHVAVVDRRQGKVTAAWPIEGAAANFPMALDEPNHRLFVGCRKPARLLVLDTQTGKAVASVDVIGDTDDLFYDAASKRIYVAGGGGKVTVVAQLAPDRYEIIGEVVTAPGARTAFFVPETGRLYVAVPKRGAQSAELRVYEVVSGR
jgi:DNA-binding beta-propeller fold protein YncE